MTTNSKWLCRLRAREVIASNRTRTDSNQGNLVIAGNRACKLANAMF